MQCWKITAAHVVYLLVVGPVLDFFSSYVQHELGVVIVLLSSQVENKLDWMS